MVRCLLTVGPYLSMSHLSSCPPVPEVVKQLSVFRELLDSLPEVLISHHVGQQGAWLTEEVGVFRKRLEEKLVAGKDQKVRRSESLVHLDGP